MAGPHPAMLSKILTLGNGVGRCLAIMGERRQLCLEISGQRLHAACWEKECCDIVPAGHIAALVNSSLCKQRGALRPPASKSGE